MGNHLNAQIFKMTVIWETPKGELGNRVDSMVMWIQKLNHLGSSKKC